MSTIEKAAPTGECRTRPVVKDRQPKNSGYSSILQIEVPTGGVFFDVVNDDGFAGFIGSAHSGDALQTIFDPPASRRGIISNRDLLALHRIHSEADLSLIKGFDRTLAILDLEMLLEISEGRA